MSAGNGITAGSERVTGTFVDFAGMSDADSQLEVIAVREEEPRAAEELESLARSGFQRQGSRPALKVYVRWWTSGVLDVVRAGEGSACAYRLIDTPSQGWGLGPTGTVLWRRKGSICEVVAAVLNLPSPNLVALGPYLSTQSNVGELSIP